MPRDELDARRRSIVDVPWTWLRQVHGARVVTVTVPGEGAGEEADAAVTAVPGAALVVHVADCAPVAMVSDDGVIGVAHAGWRGVEAGVVAATAGAMRALGATSIRAVVGPCIGPECYEFGEADLARLEGRWGSAVRGRTSDGRPALDVPAAVRAALEDAGVELVRSDDRCTACDAARLGSHRARQEPHRHGLVAWMDGGP